MSDLPAIARLITATFGLGIEESWPERLEQAIACEAAHYGTTGADLALRAGRDDRVLRDVASHLTVGESYFFRHEDQNEVLLQYLEKRLASTAGTRKLVLWSAGAAAGQEPYSVAIGLMERLPADKLANVEILATEIDRDSVRSAQDGVYHEWSLRNVTPERRRRFFRYLPNHQVQLAAQVRERVRFFNMAVQEHLPNIPSASVDAVLFRNVAIYLTRDALELVYSEIARVLKPDGCLLVGPSDPVAAGHAFVPCDPQRPSVLCRNRAQEGAHQETLRFRSAANTDTGEGCADRASRLALGARAPSNHLRALSSPAPDANDGLLRLAHQVLEHANNGELERSRALANQWVADSADPRLALLVRGQLGVASGDAKSAANDLRRALFLDPDDAIVRFWYAVALWQGGDRRRCAAQLNATLNRLRAQDDAAVLHDGKTTVAELLAATSHLKEELS